jgi:hypothetical protein
MSVLTKKTTLIGFPVAGFLLALCACQPSDTVTPPRCASPAFTAVYLTEAKFSGVWREAVHLAWTPPQTDSIAIRSFSLLRKTADDSTFDLFTRSQGIPDSITVFNDDVTPIGFPSDGYTLVSYKIFATDTLGRPGDTSDAFSLYLAPQPQLDTLNRSNWCFRWHSSRIQGSVSSLLGLWNDAATIRWQSAATEDYGSADYPLYFDACLPDSLRPLAQGTWYYALYLEAMGPEHLSMKVGSFNVP